MTPLISLAAVSGMIMASIGFGLIALRAFGAEKSLQSVLERVMSGFVLGIGILGWLLFFPGALGAFSPAVFWGAMAAGVAALFSRMSSLKGLAASRPLKPMDIALFSVLAVIAAFDLLEAIAPAADADTLAYHFALPRDFVANGEILFNARAVTGAIPLLVHMTYAAALATGGELSLTLWAAATGWAPGLLLYAVVRRHLSRTWSLVLLALFLTTPAILYGGGNGQIETRCAAFALCAVLFLLASEREASYRVLALAGICAGFFIAAKYFGLIFAGATGLVVLCHRDGLKRATVFGIAALVAGFQWYMWNYIHTGDPVFPVLTNMLQLPETVYWNSEFGKYFSETQAKSRVAAGPKHNQLAPVPDILDFSMWSKSWKAGVPDWVSFRSLFCQPPRSGYCASRIGGESCSSPSSLPVFSSPFGSSVARPSERVTFCRYIR